jgi:hypothetical protein
VLGRRLAADFLVALRDVTEADFLPPAERFALLRLLAALLAAAFFLIERRFGFCSSPVRASTKAVTALFATATAAFTFALAASPIASGAPGVRVAAFSLSLSIMFSLRILCERHTESRQGSMARTVKLWSDARASNSDERTFYDYTLPGRAPIGA